MVKRVCTRVIMLIMALMVSSTVFITDSLATNVGFSVDTKIPNNQIDKDVTYFNLRMKPEQKQTISIDVYNSISETAEFQLDLTNSTTNSNGLVTYDDLDREKDESLKYGIKDIAKFSEDGKTSKKIKMDPLSKKTVNIDLNMPKEEFD